MDELLKEIWDKETPYNRAPDDKWRSYVIPEHQRADLEVEDDCVTIVNAENGFYVM